MKKFVKVNRPIALNPLVEQDSYVPHKDIIAVVSRRPDVPSNGFFYYDVENKQDLYSWQTLEETPQAFTDKMSSHNGLEFVRLNDSFYEYVAINPLQVKYMSSSYPEITDIIMRGNLLNFRDYGQIIAKVIWLEGEHCVYCLKFKEVNTPIGDKCYVNPNRINSIQVEDYTSISPEEVEFYLEENDFADKSQLFHIVFDDATFLTVVGESIEQVSEQLGAKLL